MFKKVKVFVVILALAFSATVHTINAKSVGESDDYKRFEKIFTEWTQSFNSKDLSKTCALFSKQVTADYQGYPTKNYESICNGFDKIFKLKDQRFQYRFSLHNVYQSGDLAALRITWYLYEYKNNKLISLTKDEGIDIFKKSPADHWEIINYIGYGKVTSY